MRLHRTVSQILHRPGGQIKDTEIKKNELSLKEAMEQYIEIKGNILSPSTIRGYDQLKNNAYNDIADIKIDKITNTLIQRWASAYAAKHSPKSVKNAHSFLSSVMRSYFPDMVINTTLPGKTRQDTYVPSDHDIETLIRYIPIVTKK